MLPIMTMWETKRVSCIISTNPTDNTYVVTIYGKLKNNKVFEEVFVTADDAITQAIKLERSAHRLVLAS